MNREEKINYLKLYGFKKEDVFFKKQSVDSPVIWMYIKIEKSLFTRNYKEDTNIQIEQPILRFNKNSEVGYNISQYYNIDFEDII